VRQRYGIPEGPYLLSLGSLSPHKNVAHLVRCFAHVLAQQGIRDLSLVLAGAEGWMLDELTEDMTSLNHAASRIVQPGFIDDADQAALYSGATAFVFPSLCEGFGLPPLEAMQCGTPVICANATSLPEVVGSAGLLINPLDADDLCQAILDVYRDEPLRQRLRLAGLARAKEFSWERCAHETFARYRQALN
jgi:glycosyltransferase involved in cell wall biosynthesis